MDGAEKVNTWNEGKLQYITHTCTYDNAHSYTHITHNATHVGRGEMGQALVGRERDMWAARVDGDEKVGMDSEGSYNTTHTHVCRV